MTIWKFPLVITDIQQITVTEGAIILSVGTQNNSVCVWVMMDPKAKDQKRTIRIYGTGHEIQESEFLKFIGTVATHNDALRWHIFERHQKCGCDGPTTNPSGDCVDCGLPT